MTIRFFSFYSLEEILADSDEEFDDSDKESVKTQKSIKSQKSKKKTWIQESEDNIVDFIDPSAARNISGKILIS